MLTSFFYVVILIFLIKLLSLPFEKEVFLLYLWNVPNVGNSGWQAMLFMNFNSDNFEAFKSKYHDVAKHYEGKSISFLLGDLKASQSTFEVIFLGPTSSWSLEFYIALIFLWCFTLLIFFSPFVNWFGWQYFGLKEDQAPVIIIQKTDGQKYLKQKLEPDHIAPWLKEYMVMFLLSFNFLFFF